MPTAFPKRVFTSALFCLVASVFGQDAVLLKSRERAEGKLTGMQAGFVLLQVASDSGAVIRRLSPDQIESLSFHDNYKGLPQESIRRSAFLGLLSESDEQLLADSLQHRIDEGHFLEALSYAKLWKPKMVHAEPSLQTAFLTLLAAHRADLLDEAVVHARSLIDADPDSPHAILAWQVTAEFHLRRERWEPALWSALQPIARIQNVDTEALRPCYKIAAQAYRNLGHDSFAEGLLAELESGTPAKPSAETPLLLPSFSASELAFESLLKNPTPPHP